MVINISDTNRCIFIHIPRTAGTSIKEALDLPGRGHPTWQYFHDNYPDKWKAYTKFAVVRNPWDRVVSAFTYAKMWKSYWHNTRMGPHPDYSVLHDKTFHECCEMLKDRRDLLKHEAWFPQYLWIAGVHNNSVFMVVDHILRYENLEDDFSLLCERLDWGDIRLPKVNQSAREDYRTYYSEDTMNIVRDLYATDIDLFKYVF